MREQLNTTLGFYRPTFFKMQVNHQDNLQNINVLSDIPSAIYLHEYIHFLQDISTTHGYTNISTVVDYIKYVNQTTQSSSSTSFSVPVNPKPSPHNNTFFNLKLKKEYVGSVNDVSFATITNVTRVKKTITLKNGNVNVDKIYVDFTDKAGTKSYHEFGSHCIIESMAFCIENTIYPSLLTPTPDFPYKSAEKLIEFEYKILLHNPLNVLALCDVSLGTSDPAEFFYSMLLKMKADKFIPTIPEDIYNYCYSTVYFPLNRFKTLDQLLLDSSKTANSELCDYFTTDIFKDNKVWVNYTINTAVNIRLSNPYFILDIARGGKIQTNIPFVNILTKIGTPMVTNLVDEATFYTPLQDSHEIKLEYLWAISQIYGIYLKPLSSNPRKCELKHWCMNSCHELRQPDYTDANCYDSPWLRSYVSGLCNFSAVWRTWGMENKIPT